MGQNAMFVTLTVLISNIIYKYLLNILIDYKILYAVKHSCMNISYYVQTSYDVQT